MKLNKRIISSFGLSIFWLREYGMRNYNNVDYSMLTTMTVIENMVNGIALRDNMWEFNIEDKYHGEKS